MGADIYYESDLFEAKNQALDNCLAAEKGTPDGEEMLLRYRKALDDVEQSSDYFRDSYNSSNLLWQYDLSWWRDIGVVLDEDGHLPIAEAVKLRDIIQAKEIDKERVYKTFGESEYPFGEPVTDPDELEEWYDYFVNKRIEFLNILNRSIENNKPLYCSV